VQTGRHANTSGQKCHPKESKIKIKIQELMYKDTANVGHKEYDRTSSNWSHRSSNKSFKEKSGNHTRKAFNASQQKTAVLGT
jgi:hypothetical protein